ncbi:murein L,D-transpeptidase [Aestuariivirga sp.]|uniref:L,D-transpeptidase family protein n=1 Tax=Aestuariivirga sp. TaxID=2650926 RepID=UPI003918D1C1
MRRLIGIVLAVLLWSAAPEPAFAAGKPAPEAAAVAEAVADILTAPDRLPLPLERIRPALIAHYVRDQGDVYWVGTGRMTPFLQRLADAAEDGLNPADYPIDALMQLRDDITAEDVDGAAAAELYFSAFFVTYAADLKIGRVTPEKVDPRLFRNRKTIDVLRVLTDLQKQHYPERFLDQFESQNPHYQSLKRMLALYRAMAESVKWPSIPTGENIEPGGRDPRIPEIRKLLMLTGDHPGGGGGDVYDDETVLAVRSFQMRHGLESKGLIGKQTVMALNVPPAQRVRQIMLNMERWRWMPEDLGDHHFMVNLAGFELQEIEQQELVDRMDVVVGAVATQTPEFSDEIEYVDINPTWTVPYSIATREMLPKLRRSPMAYAGDFEVFMNGKLASWGGINWNAYGPGRFPFTFRQKPGPKNALGKVKFMFPNSHNIYLHDTPAKDKFLATTRAFSHGCIRLSRPIELAYRLVGEIAGWPKTRIDAAFESGKTTRVVLKDKIPIHLVYATAFQGENGSLEFRPDVYGRDRKLEAALAGKPTS